MTKDAERLSFDGVDTRAVPLVQPSNENVDPADLTITHMEGARLLRKDHQEEVPQ
ncbi:MAG: hypothetical protein R2789_09660 [Microthrixaceae bacterium]